MCPFGVGARAIERKLQKYHHAKERRTQQRYSPGSQHSVKADKKADCRMPILNLWTLYEKRGKRKRIERQETSTSRPCASRFCAAHVILLGRVWLVASWPWLESRPGLPPTATGLPVCLFFATFALRGPWPTTIHTEDATTRATDTTMTTITSFPKASATATTCSRASTARM